VGASVVPDDSGVLMGILIAESALTPTADIPLGGNIYPLGIFYLVTGMGDPAQDINVALDTGCVPSLSLYSPQSHF